MTVQCNGETEWDGSTTRFRKQHSSMMKLVDFTYPLHFSFLLSRLQNSHYQPESQPEVRADMR